MSRRIVERWPLAAAATITLVLQIALVLAVRNGRTPTPAAALDKSASPTQAATQSTPSLIPSTQPLCQHEECNGQAPQNMRCDDPSRTITVEPAYVQDSAGRVIGTVELRWSHLCETNWARVQVDPNGSAARIDAYLRDSDGDVLEPTLDSIEGRGGFGNMWYAPTGKIKVKACGTIGGSPESCTGLH